MNEFFLKVALAFVLSAPTAIFAQGVTPGPDTCATTATDTTAFLAVASAIFQLPCELEVLAILDIGAESTDVAGNPGWPIVVRLRTCNGLAVDSAWVPQCPTSFPVELLSFGAETQKGIVSLSWLTASELNNDYFVVERSSDGARFTDVTRIAGAGTINQVSTYQAADQPGPGTHYYRLRQVDLDGTTTHSNMLQVEVQAELRVKAYPNPASDVLHVEAPEGAKLALQTLDGRQVLQHAAAWGVSQLDLSHLPGGLYLLRVTPNGLPPTTHKVLKTH